MAWIPFDYRDFWQVPRLIVCTLSGVEYMLDSEYDEKTNAYAPIYKVYRLPEIPDPRQLAAEHPPAEEEPFFLGEIPVSGLSFDPTLRSKMDDAPLLALIRASR
jgi:hypothetical protein